MRRKLITLHEHPAFLFVVLALLIVLAGCQSDCEPKGFTLPPCPTEDSDNCHWDATRHGNGQGRSFIVVNGQVTYL